MSPNTVANIYICVYQIRLEMHKGIFTIVIVSETSQKKIGKISVRYVIITYFLVSQLVWLDPEVIKIRWESCKNYCSMIQFWLNPLSPLPISLSVTLQRFHLYIHICFSEYFHILSSRWTNGRWEKITYLIHANTILLFYYFVTLEREYNNSFRGLLIFSTYFGYTCTSTQAHRQRYTYAYTHIYVNVMYLI